LSVPETRQNYDVNNIKVPESIYMNERDKLMAQRRDERDASGHVPPPKPKWGSYAEFRLKELEFERD
jgi:hypothetical protein